MELQLNRITDGCLAEDSHASVSDPTEADVGNAIEEVLDCTEDTGSKNDEGYVTLAQAPEGSVSKGIAASLVFVFTGGRLDPGDDGATFLQLRASQLYWTVYSRTEPAGPVRRARRNSLSSIAELKASFVTYLKSPGTLPDWDWVAASDVE